MGRATESLALVHAPSRLRRSVGKWRLRTKVPEGDDVPVMDPGELPNGAIGIGFPITSSSSSCGADAELRMNELQRRIHRVSARSLESMWRFRRPERDRVFEAGNT